MKTFNGSFRGILAFLSVILVSMTVIAGPSDAGVRYKDRGKGGLNARLIAVLNSVERHFGKRVIVVSGCRSKAHNRRIGGARESYHLRCMAADIIISGVGKYRLWRYLLNAPGRGGLGTYCRSAFLHVDVGPKREWAWGCGRKYKRRAARKG